MSDIQDGSAVFTVRDKRAQALFDFVYPVGIVVALANDKKPAFMEYGTWEKVAEDRVLQGSSDSHAPGKKIEPGLPNITGTSVTSTGVGNNPNVQSGAIYFDKNNLFNSGTGMGYYQSMGATGKAGVKFDASKSNSIYGNSTTVQPPAYVVAYWQRTA